MGDRKEPKSKVGRPEAKTNQRPKRHKQGHKQELRIRASQDKDQIKEGWEGVRCKFQMDNLYNAGKPQECCLGWITQP